MARRSEFCGIAGGVLGPFVSRNNDDGGYWAIGKLYLRAKQHGETTLTLDLTLLPSRVDDELIAAQVSNYGALLRALMAKHGLPNDGLKSAAIRVEFEGVEPSPTSLPTLALERPFLAHLTIESDLGRTYQVTRRYRCWPHDALLERRSARASTR